MKVTRLFLVLSTVLFCVFPVFSQDTGAKLCGKENDPPDWILRFEIVDKDTHLPIAHARIRIIDQQGRSIEWKTNRGGIGVYLALRRTSCLPWSSTLEIAAEGYKHHSRNISRETFEYGEHDQRITFGGGFAPGTQQLIEQIVDKSYRRLYDSGTYGYNPACFEFLIELERLPGHGDVYLRPPPRERGTDKPRYRDAEPRKERESRRRDQEGGEKPRRKRELNPYPSQRQQTPTDTRIHAVTPSGNVAPLATRVAVSATGGCYSGTCPSRQGVIDGDRNSIGGFWSGASGSSQGRVVLELDQTYLLSHIRVYSQYWPPSVYGSEGCTKYQVEVSAEPLRWITVRPNAWACRPLRAHPSYAMEEIVFPVEPVKYIRVTITNSSGPVSHIWRTQIVEIEAGGANLLLHSWAR